MQHLTSLKTLMLNIILKVFLVLRVVTIALHAITCCVCKSPVAIISLPVDTLFLYSIVNVGNWFAHGCNYHHWWCRRWASPPGSCQSPLSPAVAQKGLGTPKYLSERGAESKERENKTSKIINKVKRSKVHISGRPLRSNLIFKITKMNYHWREDVL